jgi:predicted nucleic acid-binding protein
LPISGVAGSWLLDTGPLVALLSRRDASHAACRAAFEGLRGPLLTTEAVLTEAVHLLSRQAGGAQAGLDFVLQGGAVVLPMDLPRLRRCRTLLERYADLPMNFADATLVAVAEELGIGRVFTLDRRDFAVYRWRRTRRFEVLP